MKKTQLTIFLATMWISIAVANQIDSRFDGTWVGVETFPVEGRFHWNGQIPQARTVLSISNSGQNVRVVSGFVPGIYFVSPKSSGSSLIFYGSNGVQGRKECRLELSPDGNTLKESGIAVRHLSNFVVDSQHNATASSICSQVYATFQRAGSSRPPADARKTSATH